MERKSLLDKMKKSFNKTVPNSAVAVVLLFSGAVYYKYHRTVRAADLNGDGVTSEQELRDVFQGIGEEYDGFSSILRNTKKIKDYCSRR